MIKGINHQVIEITDPDNRYYTRAFFVLRPEFASVQRELLEKEAQRMFKSMDTMSSAKQKSFLHNKYISMLFNVALGALITACIYALF